MHLPIKIVGSRQSWGSFVAPLRVYAGGGSRAAALKLATSASLFRLAYDLEQGHRQRLTRVAFDSAPRPRRPLVVTVTITLEHLGRVWVAKVREPLVFGSGPTRAEALRMAQAVAVAELSRQIDVGVRRPMNRLTFVVRDVSS